MQSRKLFFAAIMVTILTFSAGLRGQGFYDGVKVTLPEPVTIGDKVLQPGEYEIRRASQFQDQVLTIFNKDKMVYQGNVITIPRSSDKTPEDTKVVLDHIGYNYYFDTIWMQGKDYGYQFVLPERVRALQRELATNIPATSTPLVQTAQDIGSAPAQDTAAVQQDQLPTETSEVAALLPEPAAQIQQPSPQPETPVQSDTLSQSNNQTPDQLPSTATNGFAYLLGGVFLLALSFFVKPARARK